MPRPAPTITSANQPDADHVAKSGAAFILEIFNARRRTTPAVTVKHAMAKPIPAEQSPETMT